MKYARFTLVACLFAAAACGTSEPPGNGNTGNGGSGNGGRGGTGAGGSNSGQGGSPGGGGAAGSNPDSGGGLGGTPAAGGDYFPLKPGNSWEYKVMEPGLSASVKVHKIVREEKVGGMGAEKNRMAMRVETHKLSLGQISDATISWQAREGSRIVRYRETACSAGSAKIENGAITCTVNEEDSWAPARLRLEERPNNMDIKAGAMWTETYMEWKTTYSFKTGSPIPTVIPVVTQTAKWEVVSIGTKVMSEAGEFPDCMVVKKTSMTENLKTYTFCKGVGKVEEKSDTQLEALTKYTVMN